MMQQKYYMMQQLSNDTRHTAPSLRSVRDDTLNQRMCIIKTFGVRAGGTHGNTHFVLRTSISMLGWHVMHPH